MKMMSVLHFWKTMLRRRRSAPRHAEHASIVLAAIALRYFRKRGAQPVDGTVPNVQATTATISRDIQAVI
ncbi:hypothetical protein [Caulobacter sp. LARHSG274]